MNREGQKIGTLTVMKDDGASRLTCACDCGREGSYPREIFKPSYRGPKSCAWCLGHPCEECGTIIPARSGQKAATCSDVCRRKRANRREQARYQKVKDTDHFKSVRAKYLDRLNKRKEQDPIFAEKMRRQHQRNLKRWRSRMNADPAKRKAYLETHRNRENQRKQKIRSNPELHKRLLNRMRENYRLLSDEGYEKRYGRKRSGRRRSKYEKENQ